MSGGWEHIRVEVDDHGVATLTFDRPEVRNALHLPMNREIRAALESLADDEEVRALVLTGAGGKAFVSGADIAELRSRRGPVALARHNARLCDAIEAFPHPTVAAIRGYALGGGCEVALACDIRVAGRSSKLGQPEVGLGIIPAAGGTWRLQRIVGLAKAKELIFTGAVVDAEEALAIGLVNHAVDDDQVMDEAYALAGAIAKQSRRAIRLAKIAIDAGRESSAATGSQMEALAQHILYDDEDKHARMTAFLERRAARRAAREAEGGDDG
ncbi:MAG: enoyl-CoA hydratase/isomerase family protein [Myxococcota bacterium]